MRELDKLAAELRTGKINRYDFLRGAAGLGLTAAVAASALDPFHAASVMAATNPNHTPAMTKKKSKYLIGFSQSELANGWRGAETDSMNAWAARPEIKAKYNFKMTIGNGDTSKQVTDVYDLVAAGCDLIVLTPREVDPLKAATDRALKAGIPVIEIDRTSKGKAGVDYVTAIESNFVLEAENIAKYFVANTTGPINYVELLGTTGASPAIDRHAGFHKIVDGISRFKMLDAQDGNFQLAPAKTIMSNWITRFGTKIDLVYGANDDMAYGAFQAAQQAGFSKPLRWASIDGTKRNIKLVSQGKWDIVVTCDPHFGPITFKTIDQYFAGKAIPTNITVNDYVITKANAAMLLSKGVGF